MAWMRHTRWFEYRGKLARMRTLSLRRKVQVPGHRRRCRPSHRWTDSALRSSTEGAFGGTRGIPPPTNRDFGSSPSLRKASPFGSSESSARRRASLGRKKSVADRRSFSDGGFPTRSPREAIRRPRGPPVGLLAPTGGRRSAGSPLLVPSCSNPRKPRVLRDKASFPLEHEAGTAPGPVVVVGRVRSPCHSLSWPAELGQEAR